MAVEYPLGTPTESGAWRAPGRVPTPPGFVPFPVEDTEQSIADRFAAIARQHANRTAIAFGDDKITYRELDARSNRLARTLRARLGPDSEPIAVLFDRGVAFFVACLGVWKAGKFLVPLDAGHPRARITQIWEDVPAKCLLADTANLTMGQMIAGEGALNLDTVELDPCADPLDLVIDPATPSAILYTSGSTGRPKGVVQQQRHLVRSVAHYINGLQVCPGDRIAFVYSLAVAISYLIFMTGLLSGATVCPVNLLQLGFERFVRWLQDEKITFMQCVPSAFRRLAAAIPPGAAFPCLRVFVMGGELSPRNNVDLFRRHFGNAVTMVNNYGLTEGTPMRQYVVRADDTFGVPFVPIGYPLPGIEVSILDPDGKELPPGEIGEIVIATRDMASAYWRDPEATARAFRVAPDDPGRWRYHTGDLGSLQPDGCLTCHGRKDSQVKIRGYRVEPAEVELALNSLPAVKEAAVVGREDERGESALAAYLVPIGDCRLSASDVQSQLRELLPYYMIPAIIHWLDQMPQTPTGKINRLALPTPSAASGGRDAPYDPPRGSLEESLARIWAEVLGVERIGRIDDFYALGGHSLLATRIASRVRELLGVELTLVDILQRPTVAALAKFMGLSAARGAEQAPPPAPAADPQAEQSVAACFADLARQYGDRPAIRCHEQSLTYRELDALSNRLARTLRDRCGPAAEPIALLFNKSVAFFVACLGVWKAGKFIVPLDPRHPRARMDQIWQDVAAKHLLADSANLPVAEAVAGSGALNLDTLETDPCSEPLDLAIDPETPSVIVYTSGSTGKPKGVVQLQRNLVWGAANYARNFGLSAQDRVACARSFGVITAYTPTLAAWLRGATVLIRDPLASDLEGFAAWLQAERITFWHSGASLLRRVAHVLTPETAPSHLRLLAFGGELSAPQDVDLFRRHFHPSTSLAHHYGVTECTPVCQGFLRADDTSVDQFLPIGRPTSGIRVTIVDADGRELPPGEVGEVVISGRYLAAGYWRDPEATARVFHEDAGDPSGRHYHPGDLGSMGHDGRLTLHGRKDGQVNVRGYRVEPGEVESALRGISGVKEAAVAARGDGRGDLILVAYLVPMGDEQPATGAIQARLRETLPHYMVPSAVVWLNEMPRTATGKIGRLALPDPPPASRDADAAYDPPRGPIEETLSCIWAEVLGLERVGRDDDFYALGGHSLLAAGIASRVRELLGVALPLADILQRPTVGAVARFVEMLPPRADGDAQASTIAPRDPAAPCPVSPAQRRLWLLDRLEPGSCMYNITRAVRMRGPVGVEALREALRALAMRHETLRTSFGMDGDEPIQVIAAHAHVPLELVDLTSTPSDDRERDLDHRLAAAARHVFDLACGPLLRVHLFRMGEDDHVLLVVIHHIISDGWSMSVLFRDLFALYRAASTGEGAALPDLPVQYGDVASWQRRQADSGQLQAHLAYWRGQLGGDLAPLDLPVDHPRPLAQTYRGARREMPLTPALRQALTAVGRRHDATLFMTLLAAFDVLLARYTGQRDIVIGIPVAGRQHTATENLIGFFINSLPVRAEISGQPTFGELLARVRDTSLAAFAHQEVPFELLVETLQPARDPARPPVFQVMFQLMNVPPRPEAAGGLALEWLPVHTGTAKYDMTMDVLEVGEGLTCRLEYNTDLFDAASIERFMEHYHVLLQGIVADAECSVAALPLLPEVERRLLLRDWNATASAYPRDRGIHRLFEEQAALTPQAIAVDDGHRGLTYADLNRRANQVARRLRQSGVRPDDRVGVCLTGSVDLVVAMLAALKTGAAYVPLDPEYPVERLAFMVADAEVAALITHERFRDRLPAAGPAILALDAEETTLAAMATADLDDSPDDGARAAYVMYTSGSTGLPKGVIVPHRAIARLVCNTDYVRLQADDVVAQAASTSFDAATFEIWGPLLAGARIAIMDREVVLSPTVFARALRERGVTTLFLTTALFNLLAREAPGAFSSLRHLLFGGEAVDPRWVRAALADGPPARLLHVYGPTECTTFATWRLVEQVPADATTVPIGRPIANTEAYVLDENLQPVPIGVAGELHLGGDGLADGYLNQPALTAERFVPHRFSASADALLYRTGDRVRYLPDGAIEFLGRFDTQLKIRGHRIEPGEIEATLLKHPEVRACVVLALQDAGGDKRLVAYVVGEATAESLRGYLRSRLPAYLVPSAIVLLDALPLTTGGKIDRAQLPAPERAERDPDAIVGARDALEHQLVSIWEETLGVSPVGIDDDFFDLGGHSLLTPRLFALIKERLGRDLPLATLFQASTVAGMAELLRQQGWTPPWASLIPIQPSGSRRPFYCVHPAGGDILMYRDLSRVLGADQPFYGLQESRDDARAHALDTVDGMAAYYLDQVRAFQPEGPYMIGGYSFGGIVAYEMAKQLRAEGAEVGLLALLDTGAPGYRPPKTVVRHRVLPQVDYYRQMGILKFLRSRPASLSRAVMRVSIHAAFRWCRLTGRPFPRRLRNVGRYLFYHLARKRYLPGAYAGDLTLFRVTGSPGRPVVEGDMGWRDWVTGEVKIVNVPGHHNDMLTTAHVDALAEALGGCLQRAQGGGDAA